MVMVLIPRANRHLECYDPVGPQMTVSTNLVNQVSRVDRIPGSRICWMTALSNLKGENCGFQMQPASGRTTVSEAGKYHVILISDTALRSGR